MPPKAKAKACLPPKHCEPRGCGFTYTGFEGKEYWKKLHDTVESLPCGPCSTHGKQVMGFMHDFINLGLGKKAHDKANFDAVLGDLNCVVKKCRADGRC
eukprot:NODE_10149_length_607_cov_126.365702_g9875_i0.p1 GENE.NODE_10149_length_607_cov_126.365702_g9875_i0~~NODE_10149_length_607_cov_126.365702_g9875_i0.p1  ORF type:complete len:116 (-),score=27.77 NODE_10149_length_607_cov_126.365702_g9875_i0:259-555(-)